METALESKTQSDRMKYNLLAYRKEGNLGNTIQTYGLTILIPNSRGIWYDDIKNRQDEILICDGWFQSPYQQIDFNTSVVFAGIHLSDFYGYDNSLTIDWMRKVGKTVGARDPDTAEYLNSIGIKSEFIGCSSLLLSKYDGPRSGIIRVDHLGSIDDMTHSFQPELNWFERWKRAEKYLSIYKTAEMVFTSRLHVALPCVAMGTPVCVQPHKDKRRFSILDYLGIKYNRPFVCDVEKIKEKFKKFLEGQLGCILEVGKPNRPMIEI